MKLKDLKLGTRLGAGFASLLALMACTTAISLHQMRSMRELNQTLGEQTRLLQLSERWKGETRLNLTRTMSIAKSGNHPQLNAYLQPQMKETSTRISAIQEDIEKSLADEEGKQLLGRVAEKRRAYIAVRNAVFELFKNGQTEQAQSDTEGKLASASDDYFGAINALATRIEKLQAERSADLDTRAQSSQSLLLMLTLLGVACGALIAWSITRSVTRPIHHAADAAKHMAGGDLSRPIQAQGADEVGAMLGALSSMQQGLRAMVEQIRLGTDGVGTASAQIAAGNQDLSSRTEQTAGSLQQTASSMEQLTGTVRQTADSARTANQLASSAREAAAKGGEVVSQVVATMDDIHAGSRRIADITGVIDGIAFQTNILALNAAVEAARAGEQGRGFAVVAAEVRSLAQRSAQAAKEIKTLIGESVGKVESGSKLVQDAGATMDEINASVLRVSDIIGEISSAAAEQSEGLAQVNGAVAQLDRMTQQNAALVEESAAAAQSLRDQAQRLGDTVERFKVRAHAAPSVTDLTSAF